MAIAIVSVALSVSSTVIMALMFIKCRKAMKGEILNIRNEQQVLKRRLPV